MSRGAFLRYLLLGPFIGAEFVPRTECFDGVDQTAPKKCCDGTIASKWCWDDRFTFDKCCQAHWRILPIENPRLDRQKMGGNVEAKELAIGFSTSQLGPDL